MNSWMKDVICEVILESRRSIEWLVRECMISSVRKQAASSKEGNIMGVCFPVVPVYEAT